MASWDVFLFALVVLVVVLLVLTHLSTQLLQQAVDSTPTDEATSSTDKSLPPTRDVEQHPQPASTPESASDNHHAQSASTDAPTSHIEQESVTLSTRALWANVVLTQGLFGLLLAAIAWYTDVPVAAFGLVVESIPTVTVATGVAFGVAFYVLSELSVRGFQRLGTEPPTELREALAAETPGGWLVLLAVVLPVIAIFEELLFRGAMIGALSVGFDGPVWLLAVVSSVAFGLGHSAQGRAGMVVTGLLGGGLAGVFIWTESLLVVIVAHYVINALEFVVHERG